MKPGTNLEKEKTHFKFRNYRDIKPYLELLLGGYEHNFTVKAPPLVHRNRVVAPPIVH